MGAGKIPMQKNTLLRGGSVQKNNINGIILEAFGYKPEIDENTLFVSTVLSRDPEARKATPELRIFGCKNISRTGHSILRRPNRIDSLG